MITAAGIATAGFAGLMPSPLTAASDAIRPFHVNVPEADLAELRRRLRATRWPDRETVDDGAQGVPLAKLKSLVEYWGTGYDWRKVEAKLNALPQFVTEIDGIDIHFIHVRSRHPNALPVIVTHGWPGSIIEQLKIIEPLTDPTAHGGSAEDAFDVVIPSVPGYGFSGRPTGTGWDPDRVARAWAVLMKRLGYTRYVAQGGDWGSPISSAMARQEAEGLLGIHINLPATVPPEVATVLGGGAVPPRTFRPGTRGARSAQAPSSRSNMAYSAMMATRPQTVGYGVTDTPGGACRVDLHRLQQWPRRRSPARQGRRAGQHHAVLADEHRGFGGAALLGEPLGQRIVLAAAQKTNEISLPVAITVFPDDIYRAPESWARRAYPNLIYFNEVDKGGHFAAWEQPELFSAELRAAFRSLRGRTN